MVNTTDINNTVNTIVGEMKLFGDIKSKCIVVEGRTDEEFISNYSRNSVYCCVIGDKKRNRDVFLVENPTAVSELSPENRKELIINLLKCVYNFPGLIDLPKNFKLIPMFGLVDKDFDSLSDYENFPGLAVTFTHDLETMIIATAGESVLLELPECNITQDEIKEALSLAYQLGLLRKAIIEYNKSKRAEDDRYEAKRLMATADADVDVPPVQLRWLSDSRGLVHYEEFSSDHSINVAMAVDYILNRQNNDYLTAINKRIRNGIAKFAEPYLNAKRRFEFDSSLIKSCTDSDFFDAVNGHDIISALVFINPHAKTFFERSTRRGLNRSIEVALVNGYVEKHKGCFRNNPTYEKLLSMGIIEEYTYESLEHSGRY